MGGCDLLAQVPLRTSSRLCASPPKHRHPGLGDAFAFRCASACPPFLILQPATELTLTDCERARIKVGKLLPTNHQPLRTLVLLRAERAGNPRPRA